MTNQTIIQHWQTPPLSLSDMIEQIPASIQSRKQQNIPAGSKNDPTLELIKRLNTETLLDEVWPYCYEGVNVPYTRNLIATDHESYTLLVLCWTPGQVSPIHDHPCDGCYMMVVSGSVFEKRFDPYNNEQQQSSSSSDQERDDYVSTETTTTTSLQCIAHVTYKTNHIAFINDTLGYHQIGAYHMNDTITTKGNRCNAPATKSPSSPMTVTLHLYCPPIRDCTVFEPSSVSSQVQHDVDERQIYNPRSKPISHYSEYGRKC